MELDDMKNIWQQYDKVLQENKTLNEQLVNHLLKDKSNVVRRLVGLEYIGISICAIVIVFLVLTSRTAGYSMLMGICYIISLASVIASLIFGLVKIKKLNTIDLSSNTVTDTAEKMQRFRLMITVERTVSVIASPILIMALFAILSLHVQGVDVFENISDYMPRLICAFVAGIIAMLVLYRTLYFSNIKQVLQNLKEIEEFKKE